MTATRRLAASGRLTLIAANVAPALPANTFRAIADRTGDYETVDGDEVSGYVEDVYGTLFSYSRNADGTFYVVEV